MAAHHHHRASGTDSGAESSPESGAGDGTGIGNARRLGFAFVLVLLYTIAEALGGWYTGSLALLADATHMLSDVAALGVALGAIWLSRRPPNQRRTYGFYRAEVLGALINGVALVVISVVIFIEALERLAQPPEVLGGAMLVVATGGLLVNLTGLFILRDGHRHSLNVRGAFLHMMADALGSVGAMVSATLIWQFDWRLADPLASFLIGTLVLGSAVALIRETIGVLMESAPRRLDVDEVAASLVEVEGVDSVHDLHAWTIGTGREALTAHVVVEAAEEPDHLLARLRRLLRDRFRLTHVTLQVEHRRCDCCTCEDGRCTFVPEADSERGEAEER